MRKTVHTVIAAFAIFLLASCNGGSTSSAPDGIGANWTIPQNEIADGGPGKDGIPSIDRPVYGTIDDPSLDFLREDDYVAAVSVGGEILAFPHPILNYHEIVNAKVGSDDFVLSYCPLTGSAVAWDVDNFILKPEFGVSGLLYNSNLLLYDRSTGSHWSQMMQKAVRGSRVGEIPDRIQVIETTWATWKAMYPDSKVLTTETGNERDYFAYPYGNYRWNDNLLFPVSREDNRLHPKRRVIGMHSGNASKVFQLDVFPSEMVALQQQFDGKPVVIIGNSTANIAAIYSRELADGTILDFNPVQDQLPIVMTDSEGNTWDIFGSAVSGPRAGEQLAMTESFTALWFAWATFFNSYSL